MSLGIPRVFRDLIRLETIRLTNLFTERDRRAQPVNVNSIECEFKLCHGRQPQSQRTISGLFAV